jgi:hypothetical protein
MESSVTRTLYCLALLPLFTPLLPRPADADERKATPVIALKQEYSDNLFFTADNPESDFISTVSPGLELLNNTERLKAGLKLRLDSVSYADNSDLNNIDQDYSGSVRYAVSPLANLFSSAGYRRDSRVDRDFTETGLTTNAATRDQYRAQFGGDYAWSEIVGMQMQYAYAEDAYQGGNYTDYQSHDVTWTISRDLSAYLANTVGRLNFGVTEYKTEDSQVTNYTGMIGAERKLNELYSYFLDFGLHYTESTFDAIRLVPTSIPSLYLAVPYEEQTQGSGLTGRAGLSYQDELNDGRLSFSHDVQAASGRNGTVERTAVQASAGRRLTEKSRVVFSAGYAINKSTDDALSADITDENSLWLQPKITYVLTDQLTLESSYNYALIHDNAADNDRDRNLVLLQLKYQYPLFE